MSTVNLGRVQGAGVWSGRASSTGSSGFKGYLSLNATMPIKPQTNDLIVMEMNMPIGSFQVRAGDVFFLKTINGYEFETDGFTPLFFIGGAAGIDGYSIWTGQHLGGIGNDLRFQMTSVADVKIGDSIVAAASTLNPAIIGNVYKIVEKVDATNIVATSNVSIGNIRGPASETVTKLIAYDDYNPAIHTIIGYYYLFEAVLNGVSFYSQYFLNMVLNKQPIERSHNCVFLNEVEGGVETTAELRIIINTVYDENAAYKLTIDSLGPGIVGVVKNAMNEIMYLRTNLTEDMFTINSMYFLVNEKQA